MKKILLAVIVAVSLVGCTRPNEAQRVLGAQGYTNVQITGFRFFGCSSGDNDDDLFHTGFVATGVNGSTITGVVCSGLLKGATVRID